MTVKEAAKLLEVSPNTVYALCREGLLGHIRIGIRGGTIRITQDDIDEFKEAARAKGAAPRKVPVCGKPPKEKKIKIDPTKYVYEFV